MQYIQMQIPFLVNYFCYAKPLTLYWLAIQKSKLHLFSFDAYIFRVLDFKKIKLMRNTLKSKIDIFVKRKIAFNLRVVLVKWIF
jgi:hypothetical protein